MTSGFGHFNNLVTATHNVFHHQPLSTNDWWLILMISMLQVWTGHIYSGYDSTPQWSTCIDLVQEESPLMYCMFLFCFFYFIAITYSNISCPFTVCLDWNTTVRTSSREQNHWFRLSGDHSKQPLIKIIITTWKWHVGVQVWGDLKIPGNHLTCT